MRRTRRWGRYALGTMFAGVFLVGGIVAGGAPVHPTCGMTGAAVYDADLARILATIRHLESRGDYTAQAAGSSASGAYQFLDSSWAGYGGYATAAEAPAEVQDAKAAEWVAKILTANAGDVAAIPVVWYIGHVPAAGSAEWDTVPHPGAGNVLTPREYQTRWLTQYEQPAVPTIGVEEPDAGPSCVGVLTPGDTTIPPGVTRLVGSAISWGGFENGQIPYEAMRYSPRSGYMHPAASVAWDQLHAAALSEGYDLSGSGYRPREAGGRTAGTSNHGWGLAVDVAVLVVGPGHTYATTEAAFGSPEYLWLHEHAAEYGFLNPDFAKPAALGGTGAGGWVGDSCCYLEPWHWEWAAFMNQSTASGES